MFFNSLYRDSETRVENKIFIHKLQQKAMEREMEEKVEAAEREKVYRKKQQLKEEKLVQVSG